jgi:glycosyltransferase involved in cell wall biosynthesis
MPHDAVMHAFRRSMFTLAPSRWPEPFGVVVLEALAMGRPVIAARSGGIPETVIDGECGFLVPPGDVDALRDRMCLLLGDPLRRVEMGIAASRRAADFYKDGVVDRIEQVYTDLLASR